MMKKMNGRLADNIIHTHFLWTKRPYRNVFTLKPHCIQCCHFKVDDVSALEAISKTPVRIVEDNVTELVTYAMTLVMAWMP
jgi:hypothetical protein